MEAVARTRFVRISPQKLRLVCELMAGKKVDQALSILEFTPKKGAKIVSKVLAGGDRQCARSAERRRGSAFRQTRDCRYRADLEAVDDARAYAFDADPEAHQPSDGNRGRAGVVKDSMGQKTHPRGLRLGIIEGWDSQVVRQPRLRGAAARRFEAARVYQEAALSRRDFARSKSSGWPTRPRSIFTPRVRES